MNKFFALLTVGLLMIAGIRAPESSLRTNGFCSSGPVIEKAHDSQSDAPEFRRTASNPMTLHSGFAPSAHPFDMPMGVHLPPKMDKDAKEISLPALFLSHFSSSQDRPPAFHLF